MENTKNSRTPNAERTVSQVVDQMHKHFQKNGYFPAEDMRRVFGDPAESVEVQTSDKFSAAAKRHA